MSGSNLDRRSFLKAIGGLSGSVLLAPTPLLAADPPPSHKKPNFVVIVADDQCYRTINALNNQEVHTPTFDRLLARGTTFTHCFHQGSWQGAVCVASRAMLITGRYLWQCGGNNCGSYPLLGETLQTAGYDTYVTGKWHNGDQTALRSFTTGKAIGPGFYGSTPPNGLAYNRPRPDDPWTPWDPKYRGHWTPHDLWDIEHPKQEVATTLDAPNPRKASKHYKADQHAAALYADTAIELLQRAASHPERPFFMYVAWNAPHDPRQAPKEYVDMYPAEKIEVPPNYLPEYPFDLGDSKGRDEILAPFPRTREDVQVHRREYYALLSYMDHQLGRILDALDKSGQTDNTYVFITGDHGLAVGEHGLMGKQNLYDCSIRMPFIVTGPGIAAGRRVDSMMYQHSIFPTICDLAGIATPATVQFPSIAPLVRGERTSTFDSIYCAYRGFQRMVRTDKYKLILYPQAKQIQLFDIEKDPWEIKNLASNPANAKTIAELFAELKKWQGRVGDTLTLDPATFGIKA